MFMRRSFSQGDADIISRRKSGLVTETMKIPKARPASVTYRAAILSRRSPQEAALWSLRHWRSERRGEKEKEKKREIISRTSGVSNNEIPFQLHASKTVSKTRAGNILSGLTFIRIYQVAKKQRVKTRDDLSFVDSCVNGPVESDCLE